MTDDHAAHRILPANEPPPAPDTMIAPAGLRIRELERELAVCRANHAAAAEAARNTCACKFDDDGNEPVKQCLYHAEQAAENARLRRALDAAETKLASLRRSITAIPGGDPLLPQVAVEPWDVGDERDYGF